MKEFFRNIFYPILRLFEMGEGEYNYKASQRKILIVVGVLFLILSGISAVSVSVSNEMGGLIPFVVFFIVGFVCEIVGLLGNDRAVSKIWGNR